VGTATPSPTSTFEGGGAVCGNGFLEPGEFFTDPILGVVGDAGGSECSEDGRVEDCTPGSEQFSVNVYFRPAPGTSPTGFSIAIGYRSAVGSIPGTGLASTVRQRVVFVPPAPTFFPNDRDYAIRVLTTASTPFAEGRVFTLNFDLCDGAGTPAADSFGCIVEGCTGAGGSITGCSCAISLP